MAGTTGEGHFVKALSKQPEIGKAYSDFSADYPQYWVDIDAAKCQRAGAPSKILETVASYFGGNYISNFNRFSRLYNVTMQASPESRGTCRQNTSAIGLHLQMGRTEP